MAIQQVNKSKKAALAKNIDKKNTKHKKRVEIKFASNPSTAIKSEKVTAISDTSKGIIDSITESLGLNFYSKELIEDTLSMIKKSETHLIGLIKYYEGDPKNCYEGNLEIYNDRFGKKTKGFGCTKRTVSIKTQEQAYIQLEKDLKEAAEFAKNKINNRLEKGTFEKLPSSIKEGIIDLSFCKGPNAVVENKKILDAIKNNDYSGIVGNLYYLHSADKNNGTEENPGLYRRSLSRAILAFRDLTGKEKTEAEKEIDNLYQKAKNCFEKNNEDTKELNNIYSYFKTKTFITTTNDIKPVKPIDNTNKKNSSSVDTTVLKRLTSGTYNFKVDESFKGKGAFAVAKANYEAQDTDKMTFSEFYKLFNEINSKDTLENIKVGDTVKVPQITGGKTPVQKTEPNKNKTAVKKPNTKQQKTNKSNPIKNLFVGLYNKVFEKQQELANTMKSEKDNIVVTEFENNQNTTPLENVLKEKNKKISKYTFIIKKRDGSRETYSTHTISLDYEVKPKETVWGITHRFGVDMEEFCKNNNIENCNYIQAGQKVKIQKIAYKIEKGDTLYGISKKFGLTPDILMQLNGIEEEEITNLEIGKMIELPGLIYKVKKGETPESIARKFGIDTKILMNINGRKIAPGMEIRVLYNNSDYNKTPDAIKTKVIAGQKVEKIDMSGTDKILKDPKYKYLRYKTKVNNSVVPNREEFMPTGKGQLSGKTIIINAGHGYGPAKRDPGAIFEKEAGFKHEWILNYDNAMNLIPRLQAQGARVIYLQGHVNLIQKALKRPENKGDLFISIHANMGKGDNTTKDRTQFYYRDKIEKGSARERSIILAQIAEKVFDTNYKSKDFAETRTHDERTGVLKTPVIKQKIPGIIWEVAFMDSPEGRKRLNDKKTMDNYMNLMVKSLSKYFEYIDSKKNKTQA